MKCSICDKEMTSEERHYYGSTCEQCEIDWTNQINQEISEMDVEMNPMFDSEL